MNHFTTIDDLGADGLATALDKALAWKKDGPGDHLKDRVLGMVFFNPSLRTRTSFETAMLRGGGHAVVLEVGGGVWKLESREGVVMDGEFSEHLKEAIPVLGRYCDALGVRSFSSGEGDIVDLTEPVVSAFRRHAGVPVVSMEGASEHPCQGLADALTLRENFGDTKDLPVTLTWAPHIKPLPKAVPNSFVLSAAASGCDVRICHPPGFDLPPAVLERARSFGGSVTVTNDQREALEGSACCYAKSWGGGDLNQPDWTVTNSHFENMRDDAIFMHCLPVRRNLVVADEVLDGPRSRVIDQAENRFHGQRVILDRMIGDAA